MATATFDPSKPVEAFSDVLPDELAPRFDPTRPVEAFSDTLPDVPRQLPDNATIARTLRMVPQAPPPPAAPPESPLIRDPNAELRARRETMHLMRSISGKPEEPTRELPEHLKPLNLLAQGGFGLMQGFHDLGTQGASVAQALNEPIAQAGPFALTARGVKPVAQSKEVAKFWREVAQEAQSRADRVETIARDVPGDEFARQLTRGAMSLVPAAAAGPLGVGAAVAASGVQQGAATLAQAQTAYEDKGVATDAQTSLMPNKAFWKSAGPAAIDAVQTAAITFVAGKLFGAGAEGLTTPAKRAAVTAKVGDILKATVGESLEEGAQQFISDGVIARLSYHPEMTLGQALNGAITAAAIGGILGGGVATLRTGLAEMLKAEAERPQATGASLRRKPPPIPKGEPDASQIESAVAQARRDQAQGVPPPAGGSPGQVQVPTGTRPDGPDAAAQGQAEVPPPAPTVAAPPGERLVTIQRADGTTYEAAVSDKSYDHPTRGRVPSVARRDERGQWTHGMLGADETILTPPPTPTSTAQGAGTLPGPAAGPVPGGTTAPAAPVTSPVTEISKPQPKGGDKSERQKAQGQKGLQVIPPAVAGAGAPVAPNPLPDLPTWRGQTHTVQRTGKDSRYVPATGEPTLWPGVTSKRQAVDLQWFTERLKLGEITPDEYTQAIAGIRANPMYGRGKTVEKPSPTSAKEPWQMTRREAADASEVAPHAAGPQNGFNVRITGTGEWRFTRETTPSKAKAAIHEYYVRTAIEQGKPVTPEVLSDYPGLVEPELKPAEPLDTLGNPESFYDPKKLMGAQMRRSTKLAAAMKFYGAKNVKELNRLATRRFDEMRQRTAGNPTLAADLALLADAIQSVRAKLTNPEQFDLLKVAKSPKPLVAVRDQIRRIIDNMESGQFSTSEGWREKVLPKLERRLAEIEAQLAGKPSPFAAPADDTVEALAKFLSDKAYNEGKPIRPGQALTAAHTMILAGFKTPQEAADSALDMINRGRGDESFHLPDGSPISWHETLKSALAMGAVVPEKIVVGGAAAPVAEPEPKPAAPPPPPKKPKEAPPVAPVEDRSREELIRKERSDAIAALDEQLKDIKRRRKAVRVEFKGVKPVSPMNRTTPSIERGQKFQSALNALDIEENDVGRQWAKLKKEQSAETPLEQKTEPSAPAAVPVSEAAPKVLTAGNVETDADVQGAQGSKPLGTGSTFSPKVAREQKKFLLDAVDQAIAEAPETLPVVDADADLAALDDVRSYKQGDTDETFNDRRREVVDRLVEKYGVATRTPADPGLQSIIPGAMARPPAPAQNRSLDTLFLFLRGQEPTKRDAGSVGAVEKARFDQLPKVKIEVPGDGEFEIINSKAALKEFKERADKFPVSAVKPKAPSQARTGPTPAAPLGKPDKASALSALEPLVKSVPSERYVLKFVSSDGKQTVATNGRMLTLIRLGLGGTEKKPRSFTTEGKPVSEKDAGTYPNWRQVIPAETKEEMKVDTAKLFTVLRQAQEATSEKDISVKLWRNKDGSLGVTSNAPEVASYSHNVHDVDVSQVIMAVNPQYLIDAINAARRMGDETVMIKWIDELSPLIVESKMTKSVISPMRLSLETPAVGAEPDTRYTDLLRAAGGAEADAVLDALEANARNDFERALIAKFQSLGLRTTVRLAPRSEAPPATTANRTTGGIYDSDKDEITIFEGASDQHRALLHEFVHPATIEAIEQNPDFRAELEAMLAEARAALGDRHYGTRNVFEFVAEGYTDENFRADLDKIGGPGKKSLWKRFVDWVRRLFGVKAQDASLLERLIRRATPEFRAPTARVPAARFASEESSLEALYPKAGDTVDGRTVRSGAVPNTASIAASFENYRVLRGVREVAMSRFTLDESPPATDTRTRALAEAIKESGEITPLIVAVDEQGPYILEGGHRYNALKLLGAKSFPALVVEDLDDSMKAPSILPLEEPAPEAEKPPGPNDPQIEVQGIPHFVRSERMLDKEAGRQQALARFVAAGLDAEIGPDGNIRLKDEAGGFNQNAEARKLLPLARNAWNEIMDLARVGAEPNDLLVRYLDSVRNLGLRMKDRLRKGEPAAIDDRQLIEDLIQAGHQPIRQAAQMLEAVRLPRKDFIVRMQHVDAAFEGVLSEQYGGQYVRDVMQRVFAAYRDYFTPEEVARLTAAHPEFAELERLVAEANQREAGGKVYRTAQNKLKPKVAKTINQLEKQGKIDEAVAAIVQTFTKAGGKVPEPKGRNLTARELLEVMTQPETAKALDAAIGDAVRQAERNAARPIIAPELTDEELAAYDARTTDAEQDGPDPTPEQVENGLNAPKFAHWRLIRDNLTSYSPVTDDLIERLLREDFKGVKFPKGKPKPAPVKIDLTALAKSPEAERRRVLDAHLANIESILDLNRLPAAAKARLTRKIAERVAQQIKDRQREFIDSFFTPTTRPSTTAAQRLQQLLNAGIAGDARWTSDRVRQLIKRVANVHIAQDELNSLATSTRAEKQGWLDAKADEIAAREDFASVAAGARADLQALVRTHLAERLQAAEEKLVRSFLSGADSNFEPKPVDPAARERSRQTAISGLEGIIRAGGFDTPTVEAAAAKSKVGKLLPNLSEMIANIFAAPAFHRRQMADRFATQLVDELGIDPANRDKAVQVFRAAFEAKMKALATKAAEQAAAALTPEDLAIAGPGTPLHQKIINAINAGEQDDYAILKEIAKSKGVKDVDATLAEIKKLVEREHRMRTQLTKPMLDELKLTQAQADEYERTGKGLTDEQVLEYGKAKAIQSQYADTAINDLHHRLVMLWAKLTLPIGFSSGDAARNLVRAINEASRSNVLTRLTFGTIQGIDVYTGALSNTLTTALAHAKLRRMGDALHRGDAVEWFKDYAEALADAWKVSKAVTGSGSSALWQTLQTGRGQPQLIEGTGSRTHGLERLEDRARKLMASDDPAKQAEGAVELLLAQVQWGYRISGAMDRFQSGSGRFKELQGMVKTWLRTQTPTLSRLQVAQQTDEIMGDIGAMFQLHASRAPVVLAAMGEKETPAGLRVAAWNGVYGEILDRAKRAGLPTEVLAEAINRRMQLLGWNLPPGGVLETVIAKPLQALEETAARMWLPTGATTAFGRAMATAIYRKLHWSPVGLAAKRILGDSPWTETPLEQEQRKAEAKLGLPFGLLLLTAVASGLLPFLRKWPDDKEEKARMEALGLRPGMLLIPVGDGKYWSFSTTAGPISLISPYAAAGGAINDILKKRERAQAKLDAEAARLGVPAEKLAPVSFGELLNVAAAAAKESVTGTRTASGKFQAFSDTGKLVSAKGVASYVSSLVPFLPMYQNLMMLAGSNVDPKLGSFWDLVAPVPGSNAQRVDIFGQPVGSVQDMTDKIAMLTRGTGKLVDGKNLDHVPYANVFATGYIPAAVSETKGYNFGGSYRPMTQSELQTYVQKRGQYWKEELEALGPVDGLPPEEARRTVQAAYASANRTALASVGVSVPPERAGVRTSSTGQTPAVGPAAGQGVAFSGLSRPRGRSSGRTLRFSRTPSRGVRLPSRRGSLRLGFRKGPTVRRRATLRLPTRSGTLRLRRTVRTG